MWNLECQYPFSCTSFKNIGWLNDCIRIHATKDTASDLSLTSLLKHQKHASAHICMDLVNSQIRSTIFDKCFVSASPISLLPSSYSDHHKVIDFDESCLFELSCQSDSRIYTVPRRGSNHLVYWYVLVYLSGGECRSQVVFREQQSKLLFNISDCPYFGFFSWH